MYGIAIIPAIFVIFGPFFVTESPIWLVSRNRLAEAEYETLRLLKRQPEYPKEVKVKNPARGKRSPPTTTASFSKGRT
jgi:putative MFS transporter